MNGPTKSEREKLEGHAKWLEWGLIFSGCLVVAGLLWELVPPKDKFRNREMVGGAVVTLGVAGEVIFGIFISKKSNQIRELADSQIAAANERALESARAAGEANRLAGEANKAAEEAKLERDKLDAVFTRQIIRRILRPDERAVFASNLSKFNGQKFMLQLILDRENLPPDEISGEMGYMLGQLAEILRAAGWEHIHLGGFMKPKSKQLGVIVFLPPMLSSETEDNKKAFVAANALFWQLKHADLFAQIAHGNSPGTILIGVGPIR